MEAVTGVLSFGRARGKKVSKLVDPHSNLPPIPHTISGRMLRNRIPLFKTARASVSGEECTPTASFLSRSESYVDKVGSGMEGGAGSANDSNEELENEVRVVGCGPTDRWEENVNPQIVGNGSVLMTIALARRKVNLANAMKFANKIVKEGARKEKENVRCVVVTDVETQNSTEKHNVGREEEYAKLAPSEAEGDGNEGERTEERNEGGGLKMVRKLTLQKGDGMFWATTFWRDLESEFIRTVPQSVRVVDRRWGLEVRVTCFDGQEVVDWLVAYLGARCEGPREARPLAVARQQAAAVAGKLMADRLFMPARPNRRVAAADPFLDSPNVYYVLPSESNLPTTPRPPTQPEFYNLPFLPQGPSPSTATQPKTPKLGFSSTHLTRIASAIHTKFGNSPLVRARRNTEKGAPPQIMEPSRFAEPEEGPTGGKSLMWKADQVWANRRGGNRTRSVPNADEFQSLEEMLRSGC